MAARRSYGTGRLYTRTDRNGRESWYGKWHANGRRVNRKVGPKRSPGGRDGLTRAQAERELRRLMAEVQVTTPVAVSLTVAAAGERYQRHLTRAGRKRSTVAAVESALRVHLVRFFDGKALDAICHDDIVDLVAVLERRGLGPKSIRNYVGTLSALFNYARAPQRRWAAANPCEGVELPGIRESGEIRFLDEAEWEAVLRHVQTGDYESIDRAFYLTAIMAGLRHGELIALRWRDVDWVAGRIRVRQNWVLGDFDTPKSRRGSRSVPMADRLAGELDRLHKALGEPREDVLVFADPITGEPLDKAANLRRYRRVLKAAALDATHNLHGLRHTFGTRMAAAGVPMRVLQEWMGHRDIATTERYADYAPSQHESDLIERAWAPSGSRGPIRGPVLSESHITSDDVSNAVEPDRE
jgi:integrase